MAKHKTVTHLPAPPSSPRLAAQLVTAAGELIVVGLAVVGIVVVFNWLMDSPDVRRRLAPRQRPDLICFNDRRTGEWCQPDHPRRWPVNG
jgi:hypothetical protein